jgi:hypothetical protein
MRKLSEPMAEALLYVAQTGRLPFGSHDNTDAAMQRHGYVVAEREVNHAVLSRGLQLTADAWARLAHTMPGEVRDVLTCAYIAADREWLDRMVEAGHVPDFTGDPWRLAHHL